MKEIVGKGSVIMRFHEKIISSEVRKKIKNDVLPETIRFTKSVFPCLEEYDIDKLDRIMVENSVMADGFKALFTLEYDPCINLCTVKCSFYALPADNEVILTAMIKALSDQNYQDYEISHAETEEYYEEPFKRTTWTAKTSYIIENDLYTGFMQAYRKVLCAITLMYEVYEAYAIETDLAGAYPELVELTAPVYPRCKVMNRYESRFADGFCSLRRIYHSPDLKPDSTEITVEVIKARNPSAFITSETLLEKNTGNLFLSDFEYRQSFSVGEPCGGSRSILHGKDVVARFYYAGPDIYILEPLSIFFEDDITQYLIITRETDESFHFFTDMKDEIAVLEKNENNYQAIIKSSLKELAPFIVAVEELIFVPDQKQECGKTHDEDNRFRRMNKKIDMAKGIMKNWFKDDEWRELLRDPALNLFSYITWVNSFEDNLTGRKITQAEISRVQDIRSRSFGIDSDKKPAGCDIDDLKGEQMRLSDF